MRCCDMRMKENKIMKMISRRDFMKASAVVGAAGVLTACGGSSSSTAASSTAASSAAASSAAASGAATGSANVGPPARRYHDTGIRCDQTKSTNDKLTAYDHNNNPSRKILNFDIKRF